MSGPGEGKDKKLGNILVELGHATPEMLVEAMVLQKELKASGKRIFRLGEILLFRKYITSAQLHAALRMQAEKAAKSRQFAENAKAEKMQYESFRRSFVKPKEDLETNKKSFLSLFKRKKT
jgi:hypothetical protein